MKKTLIKFGRFLGSSYLCTRLTANKRFDPLAQLVEQYTFNVWVLGSSPKRITQKSLQDAQHPQRLFFVLSARDWAAYLSPFQQGERTLNSVFCKHRGYNRKNLYLLIILIGIFVGSES